MLFRSPHDPRPAHHALAVLLLFGLDAETQRADIEGIEHHLSPDTLAMLADLATFFEGNPDALKAFKQGRKRGKKG